MERKLSLFTVIILLISGCSKENNPLHFERSNFLVIVADDWSFPHYGLFDENFNTPTINSLNNSIHFSNAFCSVSSCGPSRATILTGQDFFRLKEGSVQFSNLSIEIPTYTNILEENGYEVGFSGKGWAPGSFVAGCYTRNPAGHRFSNLKSFLKDFEKNKSKNFCFWYGSVSSHRPFLTGENQESIFDSPFNNLSQEIDADLMAYASSVNYFDDEVATLINDLTSENLLESTTIIIVGDNGWSFPRGKTEMYDLGLNVPLIISSSSIKDHGVCNSMVSLTDIAPTILDMANIPVPSQITGKSLLPIFLDRNSRIRDFIVGGKERHALARPGRLGYPIRAIRTEDYLLIHNYDTTLWPCGNPDKYGDCCDSSPTKEFYIGQEKQYKTMLSLRSEYELYDINRDQYQLKNIANTSNNLSILNVLDSTLNAYLIENKDPRINGFIDWYKYPHYGM